MAPRPSGSPAPSSGLAALTPYRSSGSLLPTRTSLQSRLCLRSPAPLTGCLLPAVFRAQSLRRSFAARRGPRRVESFDVRGGSLEKADCQLLLAHQPLQLRDPVAQLFALINRMLCGLLLRPAHSPQALRAMLLKLVLPALQKLSFDPQLSRQRRNTLAALDSLYGPPT